MKEVNKRPCNRSKLRFFASKHVCPLLPGRLRSRGVSQRSSAVPVLVHNLALVLHWSCCLGHSRTTLHRLLIWSPFDAHVCCFIYVLVGLVLVVAVLFSLMFFIVLYTPHTAFTVSFHGSVLCTGPPHRPIPGHCHFFFSTNVASAVSYDIKSQEFVIL